MPFGYSRYSRRSRPYRRRFTRRSRYSRARPARAALGMVRALRSKLALEKKFFDTTISGTINDTGSITSLCNIPQGDTASARDGNQVKFDSLFLRWQINATGAAGKVTVRLMIVEDKAPQSSLPAGTGFLETFDTISLANMANTYRFRIWMDKRIQLDSQGNSGYVPASVVLDKYIRLRNKRARYTDATDDPSSGSNFFLAMVSTDPAINDLVDVAVQARLRYYDN